MPHIQDWEMFRLSSVYTVRPFRRYPVRILQSRARQPYPSMGWGGVASRAIDGNTDGLFGGGSVTHTNGAASWWKVVLCLDKTYRIDAIRIYNRATAQDRLDQFKVEIFKDGAVVVTYGPFNTFSEAYFDVPSVNGATGNEVKISIPGAYLSLAEVQIHGTEAPRIQAQHNSGFKYPTHTDSSTGAHYDIIHSDKTCPGQDERLAAGKLTRNECAQACQETKDCEYFSWREIEEIKEYNDDYSAHTVKKVGACFEEQYASDQCSQPLIDAIKGDVAANIASRTR